jgi:hypothetical protein
MAPRPGASGAAVGGLLLVLPLVAAILFLAYAWGRSASLLYVAAPIAAVAGVAILRQPRLGLLALIVAALAAPFPIGTGTEVQLNLAALLTPALFGLWVLSAAVQGRLRLAPSPVNLPLVLFLLAGLLSLGIGLVTWDPLVPRRPSFLLVQLAQWAIFAFLALAFWLTPLLARDVRWLQRMTVAFLVVGGGLALLRVIPPLYPLFLGITTGAVDRAPFWLLLSALAGGQLLFNRRLRPLAQLALAVLLLATIYYAFFLEREGASTWVGVAVTGAVLFWLRFPRLRVPLAAMVVLLGMLGIAFSAIWGFAGGDEEWQLSGVSRLILTERVLDVAMRNPLTGLGPAAYRVYASWEPLALNSRQLWLGSVVSSHNNYVDLFAHGGVVGLALFFWFAGAYGLLGLRVYKRYSQGFAGGYAAGMLAAGAASLVIMVLADWMLPFVYNIGFHGFQASVLVWLFLGGIIALENSNR